MRITETISTTPIQVEKSIRGDELRGLTSCRAGKIVPVAYVPVLREDRVTRGKIRINLEMAETLHPLMNSVSVRAYAHFIPWLANEKFTGMESFNRSYQNIPEPHNDQVIPFFHHGPYDGTKEFWRTLGIHWNPAVPLNYTPLEAYNILVNHRRKARSEKLPQRHIHDTTLAEAFWPNPILAHVVPDFDQAMLDGEVPLEFVTQKVPISGIGLNAPGVATLKDGAVVPETGDARLQASRWRVGQQWAPGTGNNSLSIREDADNPGFPAIYAELAAAGIKLSLANIELAKQTAAFAKLRTRYQGLDDDHIIDLLMEGIRTPDEALKQPILLDRKSTIFGYSERHAMDGASLDKSVTTGQTSVDLTFRTPPMNTGGTILITIEIVPEMLHERMMDRFLSAASPDNLPNFLRDYLDPEKVSIVENQHVDVLHAQRLGVFGYAPLNHEWKRSLTRIGGKYFRRHPDTFVEDRQRFWAVERLNPTLNDDFYLVKDLPHSVFMDTLSDPFQVLSLGGVQLVGNTVFGKSLEEDNGDYEAVLDQVDTARIVQAA